MHQSLVNTSGDKTSQSLLGRRGDMTPVVMTMYVYGERLLGYLLVTLYRLRYLEVIMRCHRCVL